MGRKGHMQRLDSLNRVLDVVVELEVAVRHISEDKKSHLISERLAVRDEI